MDQRTRERAHNLYSDIAVAYGNNPGRWASTKGAVRAVDRVALPYSLKQLSEWLSGGGLAQGAPLLQACMEFLGLCTESL